MKDAIMVVGEGRRKRYCVVRVGWCSTNPIIPGSFGSLEAAAAEAGITIEAVGDVYAIM